MSERGSGIGAFVLGLGIGAVVGFLFAPEGDAARVKLSRQLRGIRDLAVEKAGELGELFEGEAEEEDEGSSREVVGRRLAEAKRRRRGGKSGAAEPRAALPGAAPAAEEEDEPPA